MKSLLGNGAEFAPFLAPWLVENVKTEDDFHMEGMSTGELAVVVLVTGLVIVFVALIALILIIKIYGSVVHGVQEAHRQKQQEKLAALSQPPAVPATQTNTKPAPAVEAGIPVKSWQPSVLPCTASWGRGPRSYLCAGFPMHKDVPPGARQVFSRIHVPFNWILIAERR